MEPLVDVGWLAGHLADPDIVVLDCSVVIDRGAEGMSITNDRGPFDERHIPGAAFADLLVDLSDTEQPIGSPCRHPQRSARRWAGSVSATACVSCSTTPPDRCGHRACGGCSDSDVAVDTASLQEWAADPALPLVTD